MSIHVKLFAAARELAGVDEITVDVAVPTTVANVREALAAAAPVVAPLLGHAVFAVNQEYAADTHAVLDGDEVALIPPVSGG